jgi:penicillin-binding protein 1B
LFRWVGTALIRLTALGTIGGGLAGAWFYQGALHQVDTMLARPLWESPGSILGETVVVAGLGLGSEDVAATLQSAGYSRVQKVGAAGDFVVSARSILVRDGDEDVLITFAEGSVTSVSPDPVHHFHPTELAGLSDSAELRQPIKRSDIPEHLVLAVLAMEDARFFEHPGVDVFGILRALAVNVMGRGHQQGGSTLTQQLAKNLFLTPERSLKRKTRELALAVALESRLTKDEILEVYLNQIYLGQVNGVAICGVDQAARTYFGTTARRLSLGQAAVLAGVISAPNRYSPVRHLARAQERRNLVLDRMTKVGWLGEEEAALTKGQPVQVVRSQANRKAPWAIDHAVELIDAELGEGSVASSGLTVRTTVDALLQQVAKRAVADGIQAIEEAHPNVKGMEVALVAIDPERGDVLAMVGGRSYRASSFNRATKAARQVGSTVKPFTWLLAYETDRNLAPTTMISDEPLEREVNGELWAPRNYDGQFLGEVSMEEALAKSRNVPAIHVAEGVGLMPLVDHLKSLGLSEARAFPSTALGAFDASPLALAAAYSVFPGEGKVVSPRLIRSVRLPDGSERMKTNVLKRRIASDRAAFLTDVSLQATMAWGTGSGAAAHGVTGMVGGKTGTTDNGRDAWFVGYTNKIVVAVWVGFDKGKDLGLTGAQAALPIWSHFVSKSGRMSDILVQPPDAVISAPLCLESGLLALPDCPETEDGWFSEGTEVGEVCALHDAPRLRPGAILEALRQRLQGDKTTSVEGAGEMEPQPKGRKWGWFNRRKD